MVPFMLLPHYAQVCHQVLHNGCGQLVSLESAVSRREHCSCNAFQLLREALHGLCYIHSDSDDGGVTLVFFGDFGGTGSRIQVDGPKGGNKNDKGRRQIERR